MHFHVLGRVDPRHRLVRMMALAALTGLQPNHATANSPYPQVAAVSAQPAAPKEAAAVVYVDSRRVGRQIPTDFLGLSYEAPVLAEDEFDVRNDTLINLLSNLGSGSLRYGGNSLEYTAWSRSPRAKLDGERAVLTPADLDRLFAFSRRTGWRVILGLNLGHGDPVVDADEAAYALDRGGAQLSALEIGNEPDLYVTPWKLRPPTWGYEDYRREFETYERAIRARAPRVPIAGPATAHSLIGGPPGPVWFPQFVKDESASLTFATHHIYRMISGPAEWLASHGFATDSPRYPSITNMLSPAMMEGVANEVDAETRASAAARLRLRIAETNSSARGGQAGVSDVLAAALWGADYAFTLAEHGASGLNFHGGFACRGYTPICHSEAGYVARPLYYGMLLFSQAMPGRLVPVSMQSSANLAAHAVLGNRGRLALVLINKEAKRAASVVIEGAGAYREASLIRLTGRSLDSADGLTLGGRPVDSNGRWSPTGRESVSRNGNTFEVTVEPASAVLIRLQR
jgi:hypothetical protein